MMRDGTEYEMRKFRVGRKGGAEELAREAMGA
jgi:hypothetical protein